MFSSTSGPGGHGLQTPTNLNQVELLCVTETLKMLPLDVFFQDEKALKIVFGRGPTWGAYDSPSSLLHTCALHCHMQVRLTLVFTC